MEPLGRKSGDSFRNMPLYNQSRRGKSHKNHLARNTTKTRAAKKVRKHNIKRVKSSSVFWVIPVFLVPCTLPCLNGPCMHSCIMHSHFANYFVLMHVYLCLYALFVFSMIASVYHERFIQHL